MITKGVYRQIISERFANFVSQATTSSILVWHRPIVLAFSFKHAKNEFIEGMQGFYSSAAYSDIYCCAAGSAYIGNGCYPP